MGMDRDLSGEGGCNYTSLHPKCQWIRPVETEIEIHIVVHKLSYLLSLAMIPPPIHPPARRLSRYYFFRLLSPSPPSSALLSSLPSSTSFITAPLLSSYILPRLSSYLFHFHSSFYPFLLTCWCCQMWSTRRRKRRLSPPQTPQYMYKVCTGFVQLYSFPSFLFPSGFLPDPLLLFRVR